jgi:uncharacterized C2H2 Zn-finger protein
VHSKIEDDFTCPQCGYLCVSRKTFNQHLKKEHNVKQLRKFACSFEGCTKSFVLRGSLRTHVHQVHEESSKYPCNRCPTVLASRRALLQHIKTLHLQLEPYACDSCSFTCTYKDSLKKHIMKVHQGVVEKKIPCDVCDLQFPNVFKLRRHSMTHIDEVRSDDA